MKHIIFIISWGLLAIFLLSIGSGYFSDNFFTRFVSNISLNLLFFFFEVPILLIIVGLALLIFLPIYYLSINKKPIQIDNLDSAERGVKKFKAFYVLAIAAALLVLFLFLLQILLFPIYINT